jgi:hypothetical protein
VTKACPEPQVGKNWLDNSATGKELYIGKASAGMLIAHIAMAQKIFLRFIM